MSVDDRLRYLWKPQLVEGEPPPQQVPPSIASQDHTQGSGDPSPHEPLSRVGVGRPVGSISPTEEAEARAQRAEYRDERRLWVEKIALVLGFFGIIGLLLTLYESRLATEAALQSLDTARRQMELSERPWVTAEVALTRPIAFIEGYARDGGVEVTVKNVGHSVATDVLVAAEVMLYPDLTKDLWPHPGPREIEMRRKRLCEMSGWGVGGSVIFPEQQEVITPQARIFMTDSVEERAFDLPSESGKFVYPLLIGCVSYRSTFLMKRHVTGFIYTMSSPAHREGYIRVGEEGPVGTVKLKPSQSDEAYID